MIDTGIELERSSAVLGYTCKVFCNNMSRLKQTVAEKRTADVLSHLHHLFSVIDIPFYHLPTSCIIHPFLLNLILVYARYQTVASSWPQLLDSHFVTIGQLAVLLCRARVHKAHSYLARWDDYCEFARCTCDYKHGPAKIRMSVLPIIVMCSMILSILD